MKKRDGAGQEVPKEAPFLLPPLFKGGKGAFFASCLGRKKLSIGRFIGFKKRNLSLSTLKRSPKGRGGLLPPRGRRMPGVYMPMGGCINQAFP
jgi:hypothetical protein